MGLNIKKHTGWIVLGALFGTWALAADPEGGCAIPISALTVKDLEATMRPGKLSNKGFLGPEEKLTDVLAADEGTVVAAGLTHPELAAPLQTIVSLSIAHGPGDFEHAMGGYHYRVHVRQHEIAQISPFDRVRTVLDIGLENVETGYSFEFSGLLPHLAGYGFYEGFGSPYRLAPEKIIEMFQLRRK